MSKGSYTPEFTPLARPQDVVELDLGDGTELYEVTGIITLPYIQADQISVNPNSENRNVALTNLEVWNDWLAQYRMPRLTDELPDDVTIEADQGGRQAPLWQNQNARSAINNDTYTSQVSDIADTVTEVESLSHLTELFVFEQEPPRFTVTNNTAGTVNVDLTFSGFAFRLSQTSEAQVGNRTPIYAPVESVRGGQ